jgi:xeroderma pigmentosum group C-complementing protein
MPPKSRGRPKKILHPDGSTEQVFDIISISDSSDSSIIMTGKKPVTRGKGKGKAKASSSAVPDVYRDMLAEALPMQSGVPERPLKRRRTGRRDEPGPSSNAAKADEERNDQEDEDDLEFEDVLDRSHNEDSDAPPKLQQTAYRDSDDDDSVSDFDWEAIDFDAKPQEPSGDLELTLTKRPAPQRKSTAIRRKMVTKEQKALRLQIHKMHVLCLLAYVDKRNDWCSDSEVQSSLKPLLTKKMLTFLRPREDLSQFGRADSLKRGLDDVAKLWRTKFSITARGMRRSLWADDEKDLHNVSVIIFS